SFYFIKVEINAQPLPTANRHTHPIVGAHNVVAQATPRTLRPAPVRRRRRRRALVLIRVGVVSLWIWIWVSGIRALGRLRGRAGAGGGAAAEDVFVGGVALGAGWLVGTQRTIHPRQDERSKT
ncbi:hypothetical protein B0H13DRAFT_2507923, partial [Mycena leptocephala]